MKDNLAIVINTHSNYSDLWKIFFDRLDKFIPELKRYVFVDKDTPDTNSEIIHYNSSDRFRTQFLTCIRQVKEKYCIFISEDYLLYDNPRLDLIEKYVNILEQDKWLTFIRFTRGMDFGEPRFKNHSDLYELSSVFPYFYSQTAGVWKTRDLEKIFENTNDSDIAGSDMSQQLEILATDTCRRLDIRGLFCYHGEPKRGEHHYDSIVFPYIATALVKGKWNISEYPKELGSILEEYKIEIKKRGAV